MCTEFYHNGTKDGEFGGFAVQGYLDARHGEVRLMNKNGITKLLLAADKRGQEWHGPLKLSTRAKEIATEVCRILEAQYNTP